MSTDYKQNVSTMNVSGNTNILNIQISPQSWPRLRVTEWLFRCLSARTPSWREDSYRCVLWLFDTQGSIEFPEIIMCDGCKYCIRHELFMPVSIIMILTGTIMFIVYEITFYIIFMSGVPLAARGHAWKMSLRFFSFAVTYTQEDSWYNRYKVRTTLLERIWLLPYF